MYPYPLRQRLLEFFCVVLARRVGYDTIKVYLWGVQLESIFMGGGTLIREMTGLRYLLRGIRREQGNAHRRRPRVPVTRAMLVGVLQGIGSALTRRDAMMLSAALQLAFFGMLRVSEYTAQSSTSWDVERTLSPRDVAVGWSSRVVSVAIKVSKTDPFRIGATIKVCETGSQLCPFLALVRYLQIRGFSEGSKSCRLIPDSTNP